MMRVSQYPSGSGPVNNNGSSHTVPQVQSNSMSPVKAKTSGLGGASFATGITNINAKKGSILSQANPQLKATG